MSLEPKVAVVTGAGQGIGRGIALALAARGATVVLVGRTAPKLDGVAGEIAERGGLAWVRPCDVADRVEVHAMVDDTVTRAGRLDIVVNNAQSYAPNVWLQDVVPDDAQVCWDSGPMATLHCMQAAFPHLRERGGSIVNFGSNTAIEGTPMFAAYAMSKEATRGLTRVAAREWGRFGIRVNVVCPFGDSPTASEFNRAHPEAATEVLRRTPLGRIGDCEADVGAAIASLVSDDMSYITGATLMVDGGLCILR